MESSGRFALWCKAAMVRAIKTFAQTAVAMITVGACFGDIDWLMMISVAGVAFITSILTSIAGLPEVATEEELAGIEVEKAEAVETISKVMQAEMARNNTNAGTDPVNDYLKLDGAQHKKN